MPYSISDVIIDAILVTVISITILALNSFIFRAVINRAAFLGMEKSDVKKFIKSHSFKARFFITYINELDPMEHDGLGLAKWFQAWFKISAAAIVASEVLIWLDQLLAFVYGQRLYLNFYVLGFHATWYSIDELLGIPALGAFPISLILALPVILRLRANRKNL